MCTRCAKVCALQSANNIISYNYNRFTCTALSQLAPVRYRVDKAAVVAWPWQPNEPRPQSRSGWGLLTCAQDAAQMQLRELERV